MSIYRLVMNPEPPKLGLDSLKAAVKNDCLSHRGRFNDTGCNGMCKGHCCYKYCDHYKWVVDRAKSYAQHLRVTYQAVLKMWETQRNGRWWMNFYQDANQPLLSNKKYKVFNTANDLKLALDGTGYRCPHCGKVTYNSHVCDNPECNWNINGLLQDLDKGVFVYIRSLNYGQTMFMPVSWEVAS